MNKRILDIVLSAVGLALTSPLLLLCMFLIKRHDNGPALYRPVRTGKNGSTFRMFKLRSMRVDADKSGVASTSNSDSRITPVGHFVRRYKVDELMQLINVFFGDMSLVGPRPNLTQETELYTSEEKRLLSVRPGITDFSSIVFSDEGSILEGHSDADLAYNQLIRPWKSRLGLFYIDNRTLLVDIQLIALTVVAILSRRTALRGVCSLLAGQHADPLLIKAASRSEPLTPYPPPGSDVVIGTK